MSTTSQLDRWTGTSPGQLLRLALVIFLPVAGFAALGSQPVVQLDASWWLAWSAPLAAVVVAITAAGAVLLALRAALHTGSLAGLLNAAGKAVLAGTYAVEAMAGPASAGHVPTAASAIGGVLGAALLLGGAFLGMSGSRMTGSRQRAVSVVALFVMADVALGVVALAMAGGFRRPEETVLRFVAAALLALTAALVSLHARHALSPALLAVGTLVLALARVGSADVLVGLAALAAGMAVFVIHHAGPADARGNDTVSADAPAGGDDPPAPDERQLVDRMARELHGTIDELIQARRTIELQRIELDRATSVDELTGVASRRSILERLHFETAEARRYDHPVAVLLLDVDGLGDVNREHGLAIGDAVLREIALRMRLRVREADAIGRAGADGFLAILPHTDERGAAVFADTLRQRIGHREILTDAGALTATVSIGVAIVRPGTDLDDEEVLLNATEALASARAAGGDRIAFDRAHGLARIEERRAGGLSGDAAHQGRGA